jgi:hypothetical protein
MFSLIAESEGAERQHRKKLQDLMDQTECTLRIASAYVTDTQLLSGLQGREVHLLTYISKMDLISGASSLDALIKLVKAGVRCSYIAEGPRLHAKVYLFDDHSAVVSSANLTRRALDENLEVGVHLSGPAVARLADWFESLWARAAELDLPTLANWAQEIETERVEYSHLKKRLERQPPLSRGKAAEIVNLFASANRLFLCNSNRKNSSEDEKRMHDRGYAAAWERFNFPSHMERVEKGDAIFMFAKGCGIIGVGVAKGKCEILEPGFPGRIASYQAREWRVPVSWLTWKDDDESFSVKSRNGTFFDVTEEYPAWLRENIKQHFLRLS